jgi:hypothetical protein
MHTKLQENEPAMSTTTPTPPPPVQEPSTDDASAVARFSLSATQVVASALAATTATVAASYLGIAGTVIGAAIASVLTVVGNAVYGHSIRRTGEKVRDAVPIAARWTPRAPVPEPAPVPRRAAGRRRGTWQVLAAACLGVFAGVLVVVTGVELIAGRPLTDVVRGTGGSGTTVFGDASQPTQSVPVPPPTTVTVTPSVVVVTPTVTVTTAPVTKTTTPSTVPSGTPTPTPSTSSESGTPTSSATP